MPAPPTSESPARPFLKWAGSKRRIAKRILELLPERIGTYYEPFVGSGAVFFALAAEKRFERAVLSDRNHDLIEVYRTLKKDPRAIITVLGTFEHSEEDYYSIRDRDPAELDRIGRAARLIYLNKTGFNGLYRVNRAGRFNVPFGRYAKPNYHDPERLLAAARVLRRTSLQCMSFADACKEARPGDAVYLDPPYVPLSRSANFTAYHREAFGMAEHVELAKVFGDLAKRGVHAVLSNSDTKETRSLYAKFEVIPIDVTRPINSDASKRGSVGEILVVARARGRARTAQ